MTNKEKEKEIPRLELIPGIEAPKQEKNIEKNELPKEEKDEILNLRKTIIKNPQNNKKVNEMRRYSGIPLFPTNYLSGFTLVNEKQMIKEEEDNSNESNDSSETSSSNEKKLLLEKNDPFYIHKLNLKKKIQLLIHSQNEINKQFEKEVSIHQNKIKYLETSKNQLFDENYLINLQNINKKYKEDIKNFEKEIEEKEKLRTGKKKEFYLKMNETLNLKQDLIKEINELEKLFKYVFVEKIGKYEDPIYLKKFDFGEKEIKIELNNKTNTDKYINFDPEKINSIHQMPDNNPFFFNMK